MSWGACITTPHILTLSLSKETRVQLLPSRSKVMCWSDDIMKGTESLSHHGKVNTPLFLSKYFECTVVT